jgi:hypothetical protein
LSESMRLSYHSCLCGKYGLKSKRFNMLSLDKAAVRWQNARVATGFNARRR